jgi:hypothetical protein
MSSKISVKLLKGKNNASILADKDNVVFAPIPDQKDRCTMRKFLTIIAIWLLQSCFSQIGFTQTKSGPCDRACLEGFVEQYLDAAIAHDPKLLPLAPGAKFRMASGLCSLMLTGK